MKVSPRYFLVFLAVVNVAMVSGCAAPYTPLCAAVNKGDVEKVRAIVDGGADINYNRCDNKFADIPASALAMAITNSENSLAITKLLIEKGAHVNEYDWLGRFYLNIAAQEGNVELVKLLISSGADVNNIDNSGNTPLFYAKQTNKNIRANYFPNLTEAAKKRYRDIEKILVANGAKIPSDAEKQQHVAQIEQHVAQLQQQRLDASFEQKRRDKAESREFWKGAATLATGVAVGKATSGYSPDQQTRMMKSSMKAVDSGDTSELTETTNQVKAEQAQSHKAKMQAIEAQKERDRAAAQRAQEDERNNQAQRKLQQSQAQPRNAPSLSAGSRNDLAETSQQDQERQRKEAQAQLNAKQQSRNRNEEQLQQQARQNGQARNNSRASTSKTGGDNDRQAQDQYLRDLAAATHLKAQNCYGDYLVSGKFPKILPELVGCVDVHFRAYCPGSAQGTDGTISNWVPFAGCLGSTGEIKPKPSCKAQDLRVEVIEIVRGKGACGG